MNLKSRLTNLEAERAQRKRRAANSRANERLEADLVALSERCAGEDFTEAWCVASSPREIAAAALYELRAKSHTPALWDKVAQLSAAGGIPGKLFAALEAQHAA